MQAAEPINAKLLTDLHLSSERGGCMPFRVSRLQSLSLGATDGQLDWHPNHDEINSVAAFLTFFYLHGSRNAHSLHSLQNLLALQCLAIDFDLHTDSLEQMSSLVRSLCPLLFELSVCTGYLPSQTDDLNTAVLLF